MTGLISLEAFLLFPLRLLPLPLPPIDDPFLFFSIKISFSTLLAFLSPFPPSFPICFPLPLSPR